MSRIVLDQYSCNAILRRFVPGQNIAVTHEEDHLHVTLADVKIGIMPSFDLPMDVYPSRSDDVLHVHFKLHGLAWGVQCMLKLFGNVALFLFPSLGKRGCVHVKGACDLDVNMAEINIKTWKENGKPEDVPLSKIVKVQSIKVGNSKENMLVVDFSVN